MSARHPEENPRNAKSRGLEMLEDRCLLSAAPACAWSVPWGGFGGSAIAFNLAPAAVQTGLTTLAATDSLTAPTATQNVYLGNVNGVETYAVTLSPLASTGTPMTLTVIQTGVTYTPPTFSTSTFGAITNTSVTSKFNALATALNLTAPATSANVKVQTNADGSAVYTVTLSAASGHRHTTLSVDSDGNPTGNESVPLGTLATDTQNGLTSHAPTGATALTATSPVRVQTNYGVTTYSVTYHATGIRTTVTVYASGTLANLPSSSTVQFSAVPSVAATELQTLATAEGFTGTISATQNVTAFDETNGTTLYSLRVPVTVTTSRGTTYTHSITVTVDENGNPTVKPGSFGEFGEGRFGFGEFGWGGGGGGGFWGAFARSGFRF